MKLIVPRAQHDPSQPLFIAPFTFNGNENEARYFQYFVENASIDIAGHFDLDFWTCLVPQLSHSYPAIHHAIVAIGSFSLYQRDKASGCKESASWTGDSHATLSWALKSYNRAIKETSISIGSRMGDERIALVTCALFLCLEAMQGNELGALSLARKGQGIVNTMSHRNTDPVFPGANSTIGSINLALIFRRLSTQSALFGQPSLAPDGKPLALAPFKIPEPTPYQDLSEARADLYEIMAQIQSHMAVVNQTRLPRAQAEHQKGPSPGTNKPEVLRSLHSGKALTQTALSIWHKRLTAYCQAHSFTPSFQITTTLLLIYHRILSIGISCALDPDLSCFDMHMPDFAFIVEQITCVLRLTSKATTDSPKLAAIFTFEMSLIPTLYWTCLRCRHPSLRRRALGLLKQCPQQEGLWDRRVVVQVIERVIWIEESCSGLPVPPPPSPGEDYYRYDHVTDDYSDNAAAIGSDLLPNSSQQLPEEESRIQEVYIHLRSVVQCQNGDKVTYIRKQGPEGWEIWDEFVVIETPRQRGQF